VVNNRVKRRVNGSDNKINDMMIVMSGKENMLNEIGKIKNSYRNCLT